MKSDSTGLVSFVANHAGFFPDNRQWFSGPRYNFGTTEREEEWFLTPKRHQIKHLEFVISWFGTRRPGVRIPSPRPNYLKSDNYRHKRFALDACFVGSKFYPPSHILFIISDLEAKMSPWGETRWSARGSSRQARLRSGAERSSMPLPGDFTPALAKHSTSFSRN